MIALVFIISMLALNPIYVLFILIVYPIDLVILYACNLQNLMIVYLCLLSFAHRCKSIHNRLIVLPNHHLQHPINK